MQKNDLALSFCLGDSSVYTFAFHVSVLIFGDGELLWEAAFGVCNGQLFTRFSANPCGKIL